MAVYDKPVWEEPVIKEKQGRYEPVLSQLMKHPHTWAKIGEYKTKASAYQAALNLKNGRYKIPGIPENWEFVSDDMNVFAMYTSKSDTNGQSKAGYR